MMFIPYKTKDLGYERTPAKGMTIRVTFSNGECFDVPAQAVADSRDEHYAYEEEDTIGFIKAKKLNEYELIDWASNNMNWSELSPYATKVELPKVDFDYEGDWGNAEKKVRR